MIGLSYHEIVFSRTRKQRMMKQSCSKFPSGWRAPKHLPLHASRCFLILASIPLQHQAFPLGDYLRIIRMVLCAVLCGVCVCVC